MLENRITNYISKWYKINKRTLPWRENSTPYHIWLSEIILQQTRVDQGLNYYYHFLEVFPTIEDLAAGSIDEVLKCWQGLGYYSRARNLHFTAKDIVENYNCKFPNTFEGLLLLKGVGEYTAAAIASIAFNQPVPVVDGNVLRVITRLYGIETPVDKAVTKKMVGEMADKLLDRDDPGTFNQALMEFGSLLCIPRSPDCPQCPVNEFCYAYQKGMVDRLPVKSMRKKQRKRYFNYVVYKTSSNTIFLTNRKAGDIWTGLWEFPLVETAQYTKPEKVIQQIMDDGIVTGQVKTELPVKTYKHVLSHQIIYGSFIIISGNGKLTCTNCIEIDLQDLDKYPVSRLTERFLQEGWLSQ